MRRASDTPCGASLLSLLHGFLAAHFCPGHLLHENPLCNDLSIPEEPKNGHFAVIVLRTKSTLVGDLQMCRMISDRTLFYPVIVGSETEFPNGTIDQISFENLTEAQQRMLYVQRNLLRKTHEQDVKDMLNTFASKIMQKGGKRSDWTLDSTDKANLERYHAHMCVLCNDKIPQMPQQPQFHHEVATIQVTNSQMFTNTLHELFHNPRSFPIQVTYAEIQFPFNAPCVQKLQELQSQMHAQEDIWQDEWERKCKRPRTSSSYVKVPTLM